MLYQEAIRVFSKSPQWNGIVSPLQFHNNSYSYFSYIDFPKIASMKPLYLFCLLILTFSAAIAQKTTFFEQISGGYSSGIQGNSFGDHLGAGGPSFETIGDFLFHDRIALGWGFKSSIFEQNNSYKVFWPFFADFKVVGKGKYRPYFVLDPGYSLMYYGLPDGSIEKGSFYVGAGGGIWFPSHQLLHLFLQAEYNNYTIRTVAKNAGTTVGNVGAVSLLAGYMF